MTDRELLELAANAAGIEGVYAENGYRKICGIRKNNPDIFEYLWNPLADDGDALRLAVKLQLDINPYPNTNEVAAIKWSESRIKDKVFEFCGNDPCAATRRAIVRAAAEIGKAM